VEENSPLQDVISRLRRAGASVALVTDGSDKLAGRRFAGLITKHQIANAVIDGMDFLVD
jgi:CBS domain-containing protein